MKARALAIIAATAFSCAAVAEEKEAKMPTAAQEIVRKMCSDINTIRGNAARQLDNELKKAMQKGALEESIAIKQQIEEINAEIESSQNATPDARKLKASVAGIYTKDNGFCFTLMPNGTFKSSNNESGTWAIEQGEVICKYRNSKGFEKFLLADIAEDKFPVTNHKGNRAMTRKAR